MRYDAPPEAGWQALKYAARALDVSEQADFEIRLAEDQTAREAVAQAVDLAHSVTLMHLHSASTTEPDLPSLSADDATVTVAPRTLNARSHWTRWSGWVTAGLAASVAFFIALNQPSFPVNDTVVVPDQVTSAWAGLRAEPLPQMESPSEELAQDQQPSILELKPDTEEAMMMDWLIQGLRNDVEQNLKNN
jgi:hypothetical protein